MWSCLPKDWEADGRLDKDECDQWLNKLGEVLEPATFIKVMIELGPRLDRVRYKAQGLSTISPNISPSQPDRKARRSFSGSFGNALRKLSVGGERHSGERRSSGERSSGEVEP